MKISKNTKIIAAVLAGLFVIASATAAVAYAVSLPKTANAKSESNPDDAIAYITQSNNDLGGIDYGFEAGDVSASLPKGTIKVVGDYMYVYGYYFSGTSVNTSSLTGWTAMSESASGYGWGCTVISRTKTAYADPLGTVEGELVTNFTRAFINCSNMTDIPLVPTHASYTTSIFENCTALTKVDINGMSNLGVNAFKGCSNLERVYIGKSVTSIASSAFSGVKSGCKAFVEYKNTAIPSGWTSGWNTGLTVQYNADYLIDIVALGQ